MKQYWNNTKVICTIGPACNSRANMKKMILGGMDVARFNFSHGQPQEHLKQIRTMRALAADLKTPVAILQDLPGPKIRIGELNEDYILLREGQLFFLSSKKIIGTNAGVSVNHAVFVKGLKKNNIVYLNDGLIKLVVISLAKDRVICRVLSGGRIYPRKGVSCPNQLLKASPVTAYDLKCLKYGIEAGVDFVAVSFVQRARDILKIKKYIKKSGKQIFVVAKIERKVAIHDIDNIIRYSDAVMVARGDLGIEADLTEVPFLQKEIIRKCNALGRPVITATQMLESMVNNPQPTRAEVSDVANAILDGSDALMLSEETAVGNYPLPALKMMVDIAAKTEEHLKNSTADADFNRPAGEQLIGSFSHAAVDIAENIKAKAIVVPTNNPRGIALVSRQRPKCIIIGVTTSKSVFRGLILFWGVYPMLVGKFSSLGQTLEESIRLIKKQGIVRKGDNVLLMLTEDSHVFSSNIMQVRTIK